MTEAPVDHGLDYGIGDFRRRQTEDSREWIRKQLELPDSKTGWKDECARLERSANALHLLFTSFTAVGFTDEQAHAIIAAVVRGSDN